MCRPHPNKQWESVGTVTLTLISNGCHHAYFRTRGCRELDPAWADSSAVVALGSRRDLSCCRGHWTWLFIGCLGTLLETHCKCPSHERMTVARPPLTTAVNMVASLFPFAAAQALNQDSRKSRKHVQHCGRGFHVHKRTCLRHLESR